jgi:hypothetical protein
MPLRQAIALAEILAEIQPRSLPNNPEFAYPSTTQRS